MGQPRFPKKKMNSVEGKFDEIGIVCHDAGGAEIISSYIARNPNKYRFILAGPAVEIFKRKFGNINLSTLEGSINFCHTYLCGTSWKSDLEWNAIKLARINKRKSICFLDHWVNYKNRFIRRGFVEVPDRTIVGDVEAFEIAKNQLPGFNIELISNPYYEDIKSQIKNIRAQKKIYPKSSERLLFISENISSLRGLCLAGEDMWGYDEFDAIDYLLENLTRVNPKITEVMIRPHPSDEDGKYQKYLVNDGIKIGISDKLVSLIEDIEQTNIVAGCQSMGLIVALISEKRVISCIPPGGKECRLPNHKIEHLRNWIKR